MPKNDLKFYDMNVHPLPEGAASVSRLAKMADDYGYSGICASIHSEFTRCPKEPCGIESFEVYHGIEVVAKNANDLRRLVDKNRNRADILLVHGGDEAINRAACEDSRVDILTHPHEGSKTSGINHIIAKLAADKKVAIEFDLHPIIFNRGGSRVRTLSYYRTNLGLVKKYDAPYVITSGAMSIYDVRDIRSVMALCAIFGMTQDDVIKGLSYYPAQIIKRNSPGYVMEGVEIVE